mmetsp:Transcript_44828/g.102146  ORF Transcript_44828/g.102146 Transcript_44828/m.102146 type:complete len:202 (+) Transcript_44828:753-1358(+)
MFFSICASSSSSSCFLSWFSSSSAVWNGTVDPARRSRTDRTPPGLFEGLFAPVGVPTAGEPVSSLGVLGGVSPGKCRSFWEDVRSRYACRSLSGSQFPWSSKGAASSCEFRRAFLCSRAEVPDGPPKSSASEDRRRSSREGVLSNEDLRPMDPDLPEGRWRSSISAPLPEDRRRSISVNHPSPMFIPPSIMVRSTAPPGPF